MLRFFREMCITKMCITKLRRVESRSEVPVLQALETRGLLDWHLSSNSNHLQLFWNQSFRNRRVKMTAFKCVRARRRTWSFF